MWPVSYVRHNLPRIYSIIHEINETYCRELWDKYPGDWDRIASLAIISDDLVKMANLCVVMCRCVNGVSALHTSILKSGVFKQYYTEHPGALPGEYGRIAALSDCPQAVCDYISGMSDRFCIATFEALFVPRAWGS